MVGSAGIAVWVVYVVPVVAEAAVDAEADQEQASAGAGVVKAEFSPLTTEGQALLDEINDLCGKGEKEAVAPTTSTKRKISVAELGTDEKENAPAPLQITKTPGQRKRREVKDSVRKLDALVDSPCSTNKRLCTEDRGQVKATKIEEPAVAAEEAEGEKKRSSRFGSKIQNEP